MLLGLPLAGFLVGLGYHYGARNTPLACTIMGVEPFGSGLVVLLAVACVVSYGFSLQPAVSERTDAATVDDDEIAG